MPAEPPPTAAPVGPGPALCLSGGGFRATLFHLGAVRRLNELGLLSRVAVITSVSGGSILNGVLATRWAELEFRADGTFGNFDAAVAGPVKAFCARDLRTPVLLGTRLNPLNFPRLARDWFAVSADFLAAAYEPLYGRAALDRVAAGPRFVFCATSMTAGACWHFHAGPGGRMGDFYAGYCPTAGVSVAQAVAASSAFPPGFSALRLQVPGPEAFGRTDPWGVDRPESPKRGDQPRDRPGDPVLLTDGGVYDNLGVETVWDGSRPLIVSDAGRIFESAPRSRQWLVARLRRVTDIGLEQVAAVRKRWLLEQFTRPADPRRGTLWGLHTTLEDYRVRAGGYGPSVRPLLHRVRTDLDAFSDGEQAVLENHGYSLADAAARTYVPDFCPRPDAPFAWPHPAWAADEAAERALARSRGRGLLQDVVRFLVGRAG